MRDDTDIGGAQTAFPLTALAVLVDMKAGDELKLASAYQTVVTAYWKPVYKHIRLKWRQSSEEAKDLTQGFFAQAYEKKFFHRYEPGKARFRTFLRLCVDRYVSNECEAAGRLKRGGGVQTVSLDFALAERELQLAAPDDAASDCFDREWVRSIFGLAVEGLRDFCAAQGKQLPFQLFERYDLADPSQPRVTYKQMAAQFGIAPTDVTNHLAWARREFRRIVLDKLRTLTILDDEFREEVGFLLGVKVD